MTRARGFSAIESLVSIGALSVLVVGVATGFTVVSRTFATVSEGGANADRVDRSVGWVLDEAARGDRIDTSNDAGVVVERESIGIDEAGGSVEVALAGASLKASVDGAAAVTLPGEADSLALSYRELSRAGTGYAVEPITVAIYDIEFKPDGQARTEGYDRLELTMTSEDDRFRRDAIVSSSLPAGWSVASVSAFEVVLSGPAVVKTDLSVEIAIAEQDAWEMLCVAKLAGSEQKSETIESKDVGGSK